MTQNEPSAAVGNALLVAMSALVRLLEDQEAVPRGKFSEYLHAAIDELEALPREGSPLLTQLLTTMAIASQKRQTPKRWKPEVIPGGKDDT